MTSVVPRALRRTAPDSESEPSTTLQIRVSQYAAPLLEFILDEAGLEWREIVREELDATAVIETTTEHLDATIRTLRQRLGGNLLLSARQCGDALRDGGGVDPARDTELAQDVGYVDARGFL